MTPAVGTGGRASAPGSGSAGRRGGQRDSGSDSAEASHCAIIVVEAASGTRWMHYRTAEPLGFVDRAIDAWKNVVVLLRFGDEVVDVVPADSKEFAHGYEWRRFRWRPDRPAILDHLITAVLRMLLSSQSRDYRRRYRDVHERNVLFEIKPWRSRGVPALMRYIAGNLRMARMELAPIDLR